METKNDYNNMIKILLLDDDLTDSEYSTLMQSIIREPDYDMEVTSPDNS